MYPPRPRHAASFFGVVAFAPGHRRQMAAPQAQPQPSPSRRLMGSGVCEHAPSAWELLRCLARLACCDGAVIQPRLNAPYQQLHHAPWPHIQRPWTLSVCFPPMDALVIRHVGHRERSTRPAPPLAAAVYTHYARRPVPPSHVLPPLPVRRRLRARTCAATRLATEFVPPISNAVSRTAQVVLDMAPLSVVFSTRGEARRQPPPYQETWLSPRLCCATDSHVVDLDSEAQRALGGAADCCQETSYSYRHSEILPGSVA